MKNLGMIAAIGKNGELGKDNELLWHFKNDMKFFKENTINHPIVMGINTLNSLPKVLPNRTHLVLTHQDITSTDQVIVFHSKEELLDYISKLKEQVMVIGGASIYKQFIDYANYLLLTEINDSKEADVYFPKFNKEEWNEELLATHEEQGITYSHKKYTRKLVK